MRQLAHSRECIAGWVETDGTALVEGQAAWQTALVAGFEVKVPDICLTPGFCFFGGPAFRLVPILFRTLAPLAGSAAHTGASL